MQSTNTITVMLWAVVFSFLCLFASAGGPDQGPNGNGTLARLSERAIVNHICHICCGDAPLFVANDIVQSLGNSPVAVVVPAGPRVCTNLWCKDGVDAAVCNDNNYEVNYERGVLANYMQDVIDSCSFNTNIGPSVNGQVFYSGNINVLIKGAAGGQCNQS